MKNLSRINNLCMQSHFQLHNEETHMESPCWLTSGDGGQSSVKLKSLSSEHCEPVSPHPQDCQTYFKDGVCPLKFVLYRLPVTSETRLD